MVVQKKPSVVVFDLWGTAIKTGFTERVLFVYLRENVGTFVHNRYNENVHVKKDVDVLRKLSTADGGPVIAPDTAPLDEIERTVVAYVHACLEDFERRENHSFQQFYMHIIFDALKRGKIVTPLYSDVATQIRRWREMDIRISVVSNCFSEMAMKLLQKTDEGDMTLLLDKIIDNTVGDLSRPETYNAVLDRVGSTAGETLFITKSESEALAAEKSGLKVILCLTHNDQYDNRSKSVRHLNVIRTFNEITFRKDSSVASSRSKTKATASSQSLGKSGSAAASTQEGNGRTEAFQMPPGSQAVLYSNKSSATSQSNSRLSSSGSKSKMDSGSFDSARTTEASGANGSVKTSSKTSGMSTKGSSAAGSVYSGTSSKGSSGCVSGANNSRKSSGSVSGASSGNGSGSMANSSAYSGAPCSGAPSTLSGASGSSGTSSAAGSSAASGSSGAGSSSAGSSGAGSSGAGSSGAGSSGAGSSGAGFSGAGSSGNSSSWSSGSSGAGSSAASGHSSASGASGVSGTSASGCSGSSAASGASSKGSSTAMSGFSAASGSSSRNASSRASGTSATSSSSRASRRKR